MLNYTAYIMLHTWQELTDIDDGVPTGQFVDVGRKIESPEVGNVLKSVPQRQKISRPKR